MNQNSNSDSGGSLDQLQIDISKIKLDTDIFSYKFSNLYGNLVRFSASFPKSLALAVSGGADSMCMVAMTVKFLENCLMSCSNEISSNSHCFEGRHHNNVFELHCLIVDHQLRIESGQEALKVKQMLEAKSYKIKVKVTILKWKNELPFVGFDDNKFSYDEQEFENDEDCRLYKFLSKDHKENNDKLHKIKSNIQSRARNMRYRLMINYCKEFNIKYLLTAHNMDDQAETLMMRLISGSGVDGLSAISSHVMCKGISIVRPMLCITKSDIYDFFKHHQEWCYIEDPSNRSYKYNRNAVRALLNSMESFSCITSLPYIQDISKIKSRFASVASKIGRVRDYIKHEVKNAANEIEFFSKRFGFIVLDARKFHALHLEIASRLLMSSLSRFHDLKKDAFRSAIGSIRQHRVETLLLKLKSHLEKNIAMKYTTLGGCMISYNPKYFAIIIQRERSTIFDRQNGIYLKAQCQREQYNCNNSHNGDGNGRIFMPNLLCEHSQDPLHFRSKLEFCLQDNCFMWDKRIEIRDLTFCDSDKLSLVNRAKRIFEMPQIEIYVMNQMLYNKYLKSCCFFELLPNKKIFPISREIIFATPVFYSYHSNGYGQLYIPIINKIFTI